MLEVVFDNSIAGSLRQAKGRRRGQRTVSQGVAVYTPEGDGRDGFRPVTVETVWNADLPGAAAEVAPLVLGLDMGDLSDLGSLETRRGLLRSLLADWPDWEEDVEQTLTQARETLTRLRAAAGTGEAVRVWMADWCPGDVCGLFYVCDVLRNAEVPLSVIRAPREILRSDGTLVTYRGIGDFAPKEVGALAAAEAPLSSVQRRAYANRWRELVGENAPLRAVVNGRLMSVPEDHYDFVLRAALPETEPIKMGRLLGDALSTLTGVGDGWLYLRLRAMLAAGELRKASPGSGEHPYSALVQKA